jgi:polyhydroxybutyrate depolymerase
MRRLARLLAVATAAALLCSCSDGTPLPPLPDDPASTLGLAEGRPASVRVPSDYDPSVQYPLVILLHGYSASGGVQNLYFGLSNQVTALGFILVVPDGTVNSDGARFWNATDACCNFETDNVDDVGYLRGLIAEAQANYRVDPGRVYLFGHSNGGFMAHRMACEASDVITAIASLAGSTYLDPADCTPEQPVSMLQIHGTADDIVLYDGADQPVGIIASGYPSAPETTRRSAETAGCDLDAVVEGPDLDLDTSLDGAETQTLEYTAGCERGVDAALWTIEGGLHLPIIDRVAFSTAVIEWLKTHER